MFDAAVTNPLVWAGLAWCRCSPHKGVYQHYITELRGGPAAAAYNVQCANGDMDSPIQAAAEKTYTDGWWPGK